MESLSHDVVMVGFPSERAEEKVGGEGEEAVKLTILSRTVTVKMRGNIRFLSIAKFSH